jgi:hypothetical protein
MTYAKYRSTVQCENGGVLTMPPNPSVICEDAPNISVPDDIKKYAIGTKWEYNDRTFRYSKAAGTVGPNMAVKPYNHQAIGYRSIQAAAAKGDTSIYITTTANDDDGQGSGIFAENSLKGGIVIVYPAAGATYCFTRGIIGNSAIASYGTIRLDLDAPIPIALTTSDYAEACQSPWYQVVLGTGCIISQQVQTGCGIPAVRATSGQYLWVQTAGPTWCSPAATTGNGDNNQRGVWFQADGSVCSEDNNSDAVLGQYAGWCMSQDYAGGQGAPFFWLGIAP